MKEKILEILRHKSVNIETQAGERGIVVWEDDFEKIADEIIEKQLTKFKP